MDAFVIFHGIMLSPVVFKLVSQSYIFTGGGKGRTGIPLPDEGKFDPPLFLQQKLLSKRLQAAKFFGNKNVGKHTNFQV